MLIGNKELSEFVFKHLIEEKEQISSDLIASKTNEELGEIVRANDLAQQKIASRFNNIKLMARTDESNSSPVAPR